MAKPIKIEMIHDLVCSWCPIGYQHLKQALAWLIDEIQASVQFLPFALHPVLSIKLIISFFGLKRSGVRVRAEDHTKGGLCHAQRYWQ